jgi:hypothetical protein
VRAADARLRLGQRRLSGLQLLDEFSGGCDDEVEVIGIDLTLGAVLDGERQCGYQHRIHHPDHAQLRELAAHQSAGFILVAGQQTLVVTHVRHQRRLVRKDHRQKAQ